MILFASASPYNRSRQMILLGVFALVIVLLAPLYYLMAVPAQAYIHARVNWTLDDPQWVATDGRPQVIQVKVAGPRNLLARLKKDTPVFTPRLPTGREGRVQVPVSASQISLPQGVKVLSVSPDKLFCRLSRQAEKTLFVVVTTAGQPAAGYTVTQMWAEPFQVLARGPREILAPLDMISTLPVDISGARTMVESKTPLDLPETVRAMDPAGPVFVTVDVAQESAVKKLPGLPLTGKNTTLDYTITPPLIDLTVQGPMQTLDKLVLHKGVRAYIDMEGLEPGLYVRRARIELPLEVVLLEAEPSVFTIRLNPGPRETQNQ